MLALQVLKEHQFYAKFSKCEFLFRAVDFLSYVISGEGVEVDPKKTNVVRNWPRPLSPNNIRSFLDLVWYYWRFLDGFASIASPLTIFTQNNMKFEWSEAC